MTQALSFRAGLAAASIAVDFAPVPFLGGAVAAVAVILTACENVKVNRAQCTQLSEQCYEVLKLIRDEHGALDESHFSKAIHETESILNEIKDHVTKWADWGRIECFMKQAQIGEEIRGYAAQLEGCLQKFLITSHLKLHTWNHQFAESSRRDQDELHNLVEDLLKSNELAEAKNDDRHERTLINHDQLMSVMQSLQLEMSKLNSDSRTHAVIGRGLLGLSNASGMPLPFVQLKGSECKQLSKNPVAGTSLYDVYEGMWLEDEKVAMKALRGASVNDKNIERFNRQAEIWHKLQSKYILRFYGVGEMADGTCYLVSPWMKNGNATKYRKANPNMDPFPLLFDIARGLNFLHKQTPPVVHGGLQGSNVLISDSGGGVLADFGLSKALECFGDTPFTQSIGSASSLRWMAPELLEGGSLSPQCDIYSFGMTALELLSGIRPFPKLRMSGSVVLAVGRGERPKRQEHLCNAIDDEVWAFLDRCWATDPLDRPTMQEILQLVGSRSIKM